METNSYISHSYSFLKLFLHKLTQAIGIELFIGFSCLKNAIFIRKILSRRIGLRLCVAAWFQVCNMVIFYMCVTCDSCRCLTRWRRPRLWCRICPGGGNRHRKRLESFFTFQMVKSFPRAQKILQSQLVMLGKLIFRVVLLPSQTIDLYCKYH